MKYFMHKDEVIAKIGYGTLQDIILEKMPYSLRYSNVNYDDIEHVWTGTRAMNLGRTNAKRILNSLRVRQSDPYAIAKVCHFATLSDCYWMKDEAEDLSWDDVKFYQGVYNRKISNIALLGSTDIVLKEPSAVRTPELVAQGFSAKAWINEDSEEIWMYKIGKKELAADMILEAAHIPHLSYHECTQNDLKLFSDQKKIREVYENGEMIVKSRCLTSEQTSMISFEDFAVYAEYNNFNPYTFVRNHFHDYYYEMQYADYLLGNDDRHDENWGFFVDENTMQMTVPYPLMDHDHAFTGGDLTLQTDEQNCLMEEKIREILMEYMKIHALRPDEVKYAAREAFQKGYISEQAYLTFVGRMEHLMDLSKSLLFD